MIEEQLRGIMPGNAVVKGRLSGELPRTGELTPDAVKKAFGLELPELYAPCEDLMPRPHSCATAAATATPIRP